MGSTAKAVVNKEVKTKSPQRNGLTYPSNASPGTHPALYDCVRTFPKLELSPDFLAKLQMVNPAFQLTRPSFIQPDSIISAETAEDDALAKLGFDLASSITANAPPGVSPITVSVSLVYRGIDLVKLKNNQGDEFSFLHEPNLSIGLSPDPKNRETYQATVSFFNAHLKRNFGLIKADLEPSLSGQVAVGPGGQVSGQVQAQVEVHLSAQLSLTVSSSIGLGAKPKPGDAPDRNSIDLKSPGWSQFTVNPINVGVLWHSPDL